MASQHENRQAKNMGIPRLVRRSNLRPIISIYWSDVDASLIRGAIDAATRLSSAVMFGRTSDGGALSLCILDGDSKIKEYPHTAKDAEETLQAIMDGYVDL